MHSKIRAPEIGNQNHYLYLNAKYVISSWTIKLFSLKHLFLSCNVWNKETFKQYIACPFVILLWEIDNATPFYGNLARNLERVCYLSAWNRTRYQPRGPERQTTWFVVEQPKAKNNTFVSDRRAHIERPPWHNCNLQLLETGVSGSECQILPKVVKFCQVDP